MLLAALLLVAPGLAPQDARPHVDPLHGFRIDVPEDWQAVEQKPGPRDFTLLLVPPGTAGRTLLGVSVRELDEGEGLEALLARSLATIEAGALYSGLEQLERTFQGEARPALRVTLQSPAGPLAVEALFLVDGERGFVLQRATPPEERERWAEAFDEVLSSFAFVAPSEEARALRELEDLAARCGSELDWAASWDAAAERARASGRPVLVVMWLYGGFDLPTTPRSSLFMDADALELVAHRFVPYWHRPGQPAAFVERYGLSPTAFGQALLVVGADGEVLAESMHAADVDAAYPFLRAAAASTGGDDEPDAPVASPLERARALVTSGALERALEVLARAEGPRARLLEARVQRLLRQGGPALDALGRARAGLGRDVHDLEPELLAEEARTTLRMGRTEQARAACERLREAHPASTQAHEATVLLALLEAQAGARAPAGELLRALAAEHPESRWAWQAAALLRGGLLELEVPLDFDWPDEAVLEEALAPAPTATLPPDRFAQARDAARDWLLERQREDGTWICPSELSSTSAAGPNPFVDASTALAARALLAHLDRPGVRPAVERARDYLLSTIERRERTPPLVLFMDYTPWSDAAMLDTLAALLAAGLGDEAALRAAADALVADLAARAQPHGGWGYYVTGDLEGAAAPPTAMSFTTAAVVLALARARSAGVDVPRELLEEAGVAALEAMRDEDGVFAYSRGRGGAAGVAGGMEPGAAGRAPVCELALLRAGASDERRVERALGVFLEHVGSLAAQRGKAIMHAGAQAQGCHYVLFDYGWAAAAWREVGGGAGARVRLLERLLDCRLADGSFRDTPINGRAFGTAMALLALDALDA